MASSRLWQWVLTYALLAAVSYAQAGKATVRHHRVADSAAASPEVIATEKALDEKDYPRAKKMALAATAASPQEARAWFDLGLAERGLSEMEPAIESLRKAATLKPDFFEANLDLGLTLAAAGNNQEAIRYLRAATKLKPANPAAEDEGLFTAWLALAKILESQSPAESSAAYHQAAQLRPKDFGVHLAWARLLEKQNDPSGAEEQYEKALALDPHSTEALRGLVNVSLATQQTDKAGAALRSYLSTEPADAQAHVLLARILQQQKRSDEAAAELDAAQKLQPANPALKRELAGLFAEQGKYAAAEAQYRELAKASPRDAGLRYALGTVLMDERKFAEAEPQLIAAVELQPSLAEAYGNLATVAAENAHYELALRVLDKRAQQLPENAGTYFLRATSYDHLRQFKQASENYRHFLELANGRFPNQEWQARHRLIAIDHK
jgi:Flp pilus assembly protein TadD